MKEVLKILAIVLVILGVSGEARAAIPQAERDALIALYNSTDGDNWNSSTGWKDPPLAADGFAMPGTETAWYGITCNGGNTMVLQLNLNDNNLNGTVPAELGNLANLQQLNLRLNQLNGPIPSELGNLSNLEELDLGQNQLIGFIPPELSNLSKLWDLFFYSNQLTGSIPPELGNLTNLRYLNLGENQLTGTIPAELGNLANLRVLGLGDNHLTGPIPAELENLASIITLNLHTNQLTGTIPTELANLATLTYLYLFSNQLTGTIPTELANLPNLQNLYLNTNQLTGTIPAELGNLNNLQVLYLYENQLTGTIPAELGNPTTLEIIDLHSNQLTGPIPAELGNLMNMTYLTLHTNDLTGTIPAELGNLTNLTNLYLYSNQLTGPIPAELGNLTNLKALFLHENRLTGTIPAELGNLTNLEILLLQYNQLTGTIPVEVGNLAKLQVIDLRSNMLSGPIPTELSNLINLIDSQSDFRWNALYTPDETLRTFLNTKQFLGDWEGTQTVTPTDLTAQATGSTTIQLSWTPIEYTEDPGGYEIYNVNESSYSLVTTTANKTVSSYTVSGLNPDTTYTFALRTKTESHANNQNTVFSEFTSEVPATTDPLQYTIIASAGSGGSISPSGTVIVDHGSDQSFAITPDANYHVADVRVDGTSVGAVDSYTFLNVTENHSIDASFAADKAVVVGGGDDKVCFIAAATYGSPMAGAAETLKDHLWKVLLTNLLAGSVVKFYCGLSQLGSNHPPNDGVLRDAMSPTLRSIAYGIKHPRVSILFSLSLIITIPLALRLTRS